MRLGPSFNSYRKRTGFYDFIGTTLLGSAVEARLMTRRRTCGPCSSSTASSLSAKAFGGLVLACLPSLHHSWASVEVSNKEVLTHPSVTRMHLISLEAMQDRSISRTVALVS